MEGTITALEFLGWGLATLVSTVLAVWLYNQLTMGICRSRARMDGKVVLITGGNKGIGLQTSLDLARRGARLVIGCRSTVGVSEEIKKLVPGAEGVEVLPLDLGSFASVREFAAKVKAKYGAIHVLINNSGVVGDVNSDDPSALKKTPDGLEQIITVNYLGHCLLNHLLMDLVKKAGEEMGRAADPDYARIILVSSLASAGGDKVLKRAGKVDVQMKVLFPKFNGWAQYGWSKLAQVMYASHLAKVLDDEGANVSVASLHPGLVVTGILDGAEANLRKFLKVGAYVLGKSPVQGAQTTIHLAVAKEPKSRVHGQFFMDCRPQSGIAAPKSQNKKQYCEELWKQTHDLIGI